MFNYPLDVGWGRVAIGIYYPSGEPRLLGAEFIAAEKGGEEWR